jgi:putative peptide zinc metalloprotease protein
MQGQSIGAASAQQSGSQRSARIAADAEASRVITAPFDGVVLTEDPASLQGQQVASGQSLLNLAAAGDRALRVYVPASALRRIPSAAEMAIAIPGQFSPLHLTLPRPGGDPVTLPAGIIARQDYKGVKLPDFYAARVVLPQSAGVIPFGASGDAKIFGERRSIAARGFSILVNLVKAHLW